jgi:hypothetical protein
VRAQRVASNERADYDESVGRVSSHLEPFSAETAPQQFLTALR